MASEFEEYREKRLTRDFIELMADKVTEDSYVCSGCDCPCYLLDSIKGLHCPVCGAVVDLTQIEV